MAKGCLMTTTWLGHEVAEQLGRDDNPKSGISWVYKQDKSKEYWIEILVEAVQ
jgi:hypothetical protein